VSVVDVKGLEKAYVRGDEQVHALRGVSLTLQPGELVALVGPSGSGKSTLLNVLCGWEKPDGGSLDWTESLAGTSPDRLPWGRLAIVPQALGLLDDLTVEENILLPARLTGRLSELRPRAAELMTGLGIDHLAARYPKQTSLGEQQRCAASRALLLTPTLMLADEPTAHQDAGWTDAIFAEFRNLLRHGGACLIATHNPETWGYADRVLSMHDGNLQEGAPDPVH
jgi:ABC-type lipoprotein export system ATPase subunit